MNNLANIGLAFKARKLIAGTDLTIDGVRKKKVFVVILAIDASDNTAKMVKDKSSYYNVPVITAYSSSEISSTIGLKGRMVLGITDCGLAKMILKNENMRWYYGKKE